ncbi:CBS domain-containing protein [Thermococcus sp.]
MKDVEKALQHFHSLKLKQIMPSSASIPVVEAEAPVINVLKILRTRHHVWVVKDRKSMKLCGVIRYLDTMDILLPPKSYKFRLGMTSAVMKSLLGGAQKAEEIMERNVLTIEEDASVLDALTKMKRYRTQVLAIVAGDKLISEISLRILINELLRLLRVGGTTWSQHGYSSQSESH